MAFMVLLVRGAAVVLVCTAVVIAAPRKNAPKSEFDAEVTHVVDGDTFRFKATILNVDIRGTCRMGEYNAPEIRRKEKPEGLKAKKRLDELIGGKQVRIRTGDRDKYGRWLCTASTGTVSIGAEMREFLKGYAGLDKYL